MATKLVHVCDRCEAEQATPLRSVTVSVRHQGAQESRDLCASCLQQLALFFASPHNLRIDTESSVALAHVPPVVSIARRQTAR